MSNAEILLRAGDFHTAIGLLSQLVEEPAADPDDPKFSTEDLIEYYMLCVEIGIVAAADDANMPTNNDEALEFKQPLGDFLTKVRKMVEGEELKPKSKSAKRNLDVLRTRFNDVYNKAWYTSQTELGSRGQ